MAYYIVICANIVGSTSFETVYGSDGIRFKNRQDAISHGFTLSRSDDFNIGVVEDGRLTQIDWMDQLVDDGDEVLSRVSDQIGL